MQFIAFRYSAKLLGIRADLICNQVLGKYCKVVCSHQKTNSEICIGWDKGIIISEITVSPISFRLGTSKL